MDSQNRPFLISLVLAVLVAFFVLLKPTVEERLAPEPEKAWVAIEVEGQGVAEVGQVTIAPGTRFRLHAVLEAAGRGGEPVYYTQAEELRMAGEDVPSDRLRLWDSNRPVKIRWFTVEGERPYVQLSADEGIARFTMREFVRSDWPLTWEIPGEIDAAHDDHLENDSAVPSQVFGTQRYHVRVELYRFEDDLIPKKVIRSWGVEDLRDNIEHFPTVRLRAPGNLGPASLVFGLSQLEPPTEAEDGAEILAQIDELAHHGLVFSRATVVRDQLRDKERLTEVAWRSVDLEGELLWDSEGAAAGDLLRVGDRIVVLYEDQGIVGQLDYEDLCLDFTQGAVVRVLEDVFSGEGLAVEWASLN